MAAPTEEPPVTSQQSVDESFLELPFEPLAEAALSRARDFNATHADFRLERIRVQGIGVRDGHLQGAADSEELGFAVRVVVDGAWGFASGVVITKDEAIRVTESAVQVARVAAAMTPRPVELAAEPAHRATWVSAYDVNPFAVPTGEKVRLLSGWTTRLLAAEGVDHAAAYLDQVQENKFYADLSGSHIVQQRVRLHPEVEVYGSDERRGVSDSMRTLAPPVGRGWEALADNGDVAGEIETLPDLLRQKLAAPTVGAGRYDLVIDPSNLWLTIHESVGHATELDRALGYEANYAGTSFATPDQLGTLQYGSPQMHVTGDRIVPHGLATTGYDDEGVQAQQWDIIRSGQLVGYQLDRSMAHAYGRELNDGRSNGCAFADSPAHTPIQRMANASLQPDPQGPSTEQLIGRVERGIYVVGDRSWSIDMQRYNFQFTGQRFYAIRDGRLDGMLRDVAYQATTTDFWRSMEAVGGPQTYVLGGTMNCGKGEPGQAAPVSHGCPSALFRDVRVLNTDEER